MQRIRIPGWSHSSACLLSVPVAFLPWAGQAMAATAQIAITLPRQDSLNYHRPFVAAWIEDSAGRPVKTLAVFHDQTRIGARWLPELRQWWREAGRAMTMPADGISRPTLPAGHHVLSAANLPAGQYHLVVEAAREKAGHDVAKLPFTVAEGRASKASLKATGELGEISLVLRP